MNAEPKTHNPTLAAALHARREAGLYRQRLTLDCPQGPDVIIDGKSYTAFCSNDYLGLANHPEVIKALQTAAARYGVGSGASHLIAGHSRIHQALEEELADFTQRSRALLFSTGYMANLGVISALLGSKDAVFEDRLNHASLLDGGLLSRARFQRYPHGDTAALQKRLAARDQGRKLVVTDGVFSMDGDLAPLPALAQLCAEQSAWLMVDDAHGFGVLGDQGGGVAEHFNLDMAQLPILVGTLGKSFGTFGAFVAGSEELIETLVQFSRSYIYTTALPPAVAAATCASLKLLRQEHWRREKLQALIGQFRLGAEQLGLTLMPSTTPIQPVFIGDSAQVMAIGDSLKNQGYLVGAIRPPTVPVGSARLRITFSADHTETQVQGLLEALSFAIQRPGL